MLASPTSLEVGCGAGFAAEYLAGRYASYTGIDYSEALIELAGSRHRGRDVAFRAVDLYACDTGPRFDVVFAIGVLHHMPDVAAAVRAMASLLRPDGYLVVNEPQPANALFHLLRKARAALDSSYSAEQEELEESELVTRFREAGLGEVAARAQGLLSTPFAEVMLRPDVVAGPASRIACAVDGFLERRFNESLKRLSWNLVVAGRRPR